MLKVNVGLSRKLSRDYQSHGFSVNLEGELPFDLNDAEAAVVKIQQYYDVAEESLARQIERYESDCAIASRDEVTAPTRQISPALPMTESSPSKEPSPSPARQTDAPRPTNGAAEPATNKQVQFLLNLSKRFGLNKLQLENRIAEILGQPTGVYDLTKRDAGVVLDTLTADSKSTPARR